MKTVLRSALIIATAFTTTIAAKAQKIAHINLDSLLSMMPESKAALLLKGAP